MGADPALEPLPGDLAWVLRRPAEERAIPGHAGHWTR
jgi:hypothetical protein